MMEQKKWCIVYKTLNLLEAEIIKGNLENSQISCVLINKQDRSYLAFGTIELHVPEEQKTAAEQFIAAQKTAE